MANRVRLRAPEGAPLDCLRGNELGIYMDAQDRQERKPIPLFQEVVNSGGEGDRQNSDFGRCRRLSDVHLTDCQVNNWVVPQFENFGYIDFPSSSYVF